MQAITTVGLDIAKSVFQVHGIDAGGQVVIRRQLKRRHVPNAAMAASQVASEPYCIERHPSIFTVHGNVRWQPSIILRTCDHPLGVGFRNYFSVENRTHSTCSQVTGETLVHQSFDEPCILRPKRWWQAAHRHQTCGSHDGGRTYQ
jgi:hypothetical protein